jgi:hypothetical protein
MDDAAGANPSLFANGVPLNIEMISYGPSGAGAITLTAELKKKK